MKKIKLFGRKIDYRLNKSKRAKCLRLTVNSKAELIVTVPSFMPIIFVNRFIRQKSEWIFSAIESMQKKVEKSDQMKSSFGSYYKNKAKAALIIRERVKKIAFEYGFEYNRIVIRNQKSRWGSCSIKGNLKFNYRLMFLSPELIDYVIVHELCHLREMNHSEKFWREVENIIPNWKVRRSELKKIIF